MGRFASSINQDRAVAVLAGVILICFGLHFLDQRHDHLVPPGTWVDLGNVSTGQTAERPFSIVNTSSRAVEILEWTPTCRCMQACFPQTTVKPHQKVHAFVRTTALLPLGARSAVISIQWRFVGEQFVRTDHLVASARYVSICSLSEERLDFGTIRSAENPVSCLNVRNGNSSVRWNGLEVSSDSELLSVRLLGVPDGYQIQSQLSPSSLSTGVWKGKIRIFPLYNGTRTGDEVDVPAVAKIEGPFSVSPSVIEFSSNSARQLHFSLKIHSDARPMSELKFVGDIVRTPRIRISNGGKEAVITGVLTAPDSKGAYTGKIPIQINNDPTEILEVSFFGFTG